MESLIEKGIQTTIIKDCTEKEVMDSLLKAFERHQVLTTTVEQLLVERIAELSAIIDDLS